MIYSHILLTVAFIWAVAAITPGPNFFITVHTAVGRSRRSSLFTVLGITVGTFIWATAGYFGISILFKTAPALYYFLKLAGGVYLLYIGISLLFFNKQINLRRIEKVSAFNCLKLGLLTNLLNPKTAAFIASLYAAAIPQNAPLDIGLYCIILICTISTIWYSLVATVFSFDIPKKVYTNYRKSIENMAGGIFIFFGIKLIASK